MACFLPLLFLSRSHVFLGFCSPRKLGNFEYELNVLLPGIILFIKITLIFGKNYFNYGNGLLGKISSLKSENI